MTRRVLRPHKRLPVLPANRSSLLGWLAAVGTILVWASAFGTIRVGLRHFGATELAVLRVTTAGLALAVVAPVVRVRRPPAGDIPRLVAAGLIGMTGYQILLNNGEVVVEAGTAAILIATSPVWVALLSVVALSERVRWIGWLGIGIAFSGASVVGIAQGDGVGIGGPAGLLLVAALAQATYIVITKPLLARHRAVEVAAWAMWAGTLASVPFLPMAVTRFDGVPLQGWLAVLYLGLVPSALGFVMWGRALAAAPASVASSTLYVVPPVAALMAWAALGEVPAGGVFVGGAFILFGVALVARWGTHRETHRDPGLPVAG